MKTIALSAAVLATTDGRATALPSKPPAAAARPCVDLLHLKSVPDGSATIRELPDRGEHESALPFAMHK